MLPQFIYVVPLIATVLSIHEERCYSGSHQRDQEQSVEVVIKADRHWATLELGVKPFWNTHDTREHGENRDNDRERRAQHLGPMSLTCIEVFQIMSAF